MTKNANPFFSTWAWPARSALIACCMLLIFGCTSSPTVNTQSAPDLQLSNYKTFAFFSPLSTDHSKYGSLLSQRLKKNTRAALEAKGYVYDENNPQMLINFSTDKVQKTDVDSMPSMSPWGAGWYSPWGGYNDVYVNQYEEGTLVVDLIDAKQKQMIWQGTARAIVSKNQQTNSENIDTAITEMFNKMPSP